MINNKYYQNLSFFNFLTVKVSINMLVKVYESDEFAEYIDLKSIIKKEDGNIFEVEEIVDFKTSKKTINEDSYNSLIVKAEYNFSENQRRTLIKLACSDQMGGGTVLIRDEESTEWEKITGNSNSSIKAETIFKTFKFNSAK